jgi:hypothetical protein
VVDGLRDVIAMVTCIEGQVGSIDQMFNDGYQNIWKLFGLQEEESTD